MSNETEPPPQRESKWKDVYLIAVVLGITSSGGAAVGQFLTRSGFSLKTAIVSLSIAVVLMTVVVLFLVTSYVNGGAS